MPRPRPVDTPPERLCSVQRPCSGRVARKAQAPPVPFGRVARACTPPRRRPSAAPARTQQARSHPAPPSSTLDAPDPRNPSTTPPPPALLVVWRGRGGGSAPGALTGAPRAPARSRAARARARLPRDEAVFRYDQKGPHIHPKLIRTDVLLPLRMACQTRARTQHKVGFGFVGAAAARGRAGARGPEALGERAETPAAKSARGREMNSKRTCRQILRHRYRTNVGVGPK